MTEGDIELKKWTSFYTEAYQILSDESRLFFEKLFEVHSESPSYTSTLIFLYRKVAEIAYSNFSLAKNDEFFLIKSFNRELFESMLLISYCTEKNQSNRMKAFYISSFLKKIKYLKSLDSSTEEFKKVQFSISKTKGMEGWKAPSINSDEVKIKIRDLENELEKETYKGVYDEYFKGKNIKEWYGIEDGYKNLTQISEKLGFSFWYEHFYRNYSGLSHSTTLNQKQLLYDIHPDGKVEISDIPAPPFDLASDFMESYAFLKIIIKELTRSLNGLDNLDFIKFYTPIEGHFKIHRVDFKIAIFQDKNIICFPGA